MKIHSCLALATLLLVSCSRPAADLVDDPALGATFTREYPGYLLGTQAVSKLARPVEVALQQLAPQLAQARYTCKPSTFGHAELEYTIRLRDGRTSSGSTRHTCHGATRGSVEVNVGEANRITVRTEAGTTTSFNDFRAAVEASATSFR